MWQTPLELCFGKGPLSEDRACQAAGRRPRGEQSKAYQDAWDKCCMSELAGKSASAGTEDLEGKRQCPSSLQRLSPGAAEFSNRPTLREELALQRDGRRHCKALRKVWQGEASCSSLGCAPACLVRWLRSESHTKPEGRRPGNALLLVL